jgi:hypothetical protein
MRSEHYLTPKELAVHRQKRRNQESPSTRLKKARKQKRFKSRDLERAQARELKALDGTEVLLTIPEVRVYW